MIRTKYFDATVLITSEVFEVQRVYTKSGEDATDLIDELEAWPKVEEIVKAVAMYADARNSQKEAAK